MQNDHKESQSGVTTHKMTTNTRQVKIHAK